MDAGTAIDRLTRAEQLLLVGIAVVLAAIPLPWLDADRPVIRVDGDLQSSMTGLEAPDGQLVLGLVVVVGIVVAIDRWRTPAWGKVKAAATALGGVLTVLIGYLYVSDPARGAEGSQSALAAVEAGTGLYVVIVGGLLLIAAAVTGFRDDSTEESSEAAAASESDDGGSAEEGTGATLDEP